MHIPIMSCSSPVVDPRIYNGKDTNGPMILQHPTSQGVSINYNISVQGDTDLMLPHLTGGVKRPLLSESSSRLGTQSIKRQRTTSATIPLAQSDVNGEEDSTSECSWNANVYPSEALRCKRCKISTNKLCVAHRKFQPCSVRHRASNMHLCPSCKRSFCHVHGMLHKSVCQDKPLPTIEEEEDEELIPFDSSVQRLFSIVSTKAESIAIQSVQNPLDGSKEIIVLPDFGSCEILSTNKSVVQQKAIVDQLSWPTKRSDQFETPKWVIGTLIPIVKAVLTVYKDSIVYDPFFCTGTSHWKSFGVGSLHPCEDFWLAIQNLKPKQFEDRILVTCPPAGAIRQLCEAKGDSPAPLKRFSRWALLVPLTTQTRKCWSRLGDVQTIIINKQITFELKSRPLVNCKRYMMWIVKGFKLPVHNVNTNDGMGYFLISHLQSWTREDMYKSVVSQLQTLYREQRHTIDALQVHSVSASRAKDQSVVAHSKSQTKLSDTTSSTSHAPSTDIAKDKISKSITDSKEFDVALDDLKQKASKKDRMRQLTAIVHYIKEVTLKEPAQAARRSIDLFLASVKDIPCEGVHQLQARLLNSLQEIFKVATQPQLGYADSRSLRATIVQPILRLVLKFAVLGGEKSSRLREVCRRTVEFMIDRWPRTTSALLSSMVNEDSIKVAKDRQHLWQLLLRWSKLASKHDTNRSEEWRNIIEKLEAPLNKKDRMAFIDGCAVWDLAPLTQTAQTHTSLEDEAKDSEKEPESDPAERKNDPRSLAPQKRKRKVVTWNVNGIRARFHDGSLHRMLGEVNPDCLFIPETKCTADLFERLAGEQFRLQLYAWGYQQVLWTWCTNPARGKGIGYSGCAMFCKEAPTSYDFGTGFLNDEGRSITARWATHTIVGCYSPCSKYGEATIEERRLEWDKHLFAHIATERKSAAGDSTKNEAPKGVLLIGDLNVTPTAQDTAYNSKWDQSHMPSCKLWERKSFMDLLESSEMVDAFRRHHPVATAQDFSWFRSERNWKINKGMRNDFVLASENVYSAKRVLEPVDCYLRRWGSSDHFPLFYEFRIPAISGYSAQQANRDTQKEAQQSHDDIQCTHCCRTSEDAHVSNDAVDKNSGTGTSDKDVQAQHSNIRSSTRRTNSVCKTGQQSYSDECVLPFNGCYEKPFTTLDVETCQRVMAACRSGLQTLDDDVEETDYVPDILSETSDSESDNDDECAHDNPTASVDQSSAHKQWFDSLPTNEFAEIEASQLLQNVVVDTKVTRRMPDLLLKAACGKQGYKLPIQVLADSGAWPNVISAQVAKKLQCSKIATSSVPTFIMADSSATKPLGMVAVTIWLNTVSSMTLYAWVCEKASNDLIMGSKEFNKRQGVINYGNCTVSLKCDQSEYVTIPFQGLTTRSDVSAVNLYSSDTVVIRSGAQKVVRVLGDRRHAIVNQTWGTISNNPNTVLPIMCCKGFTEYRQKNNCIIVMNISDDDIVIRRGKLVGLFNPEDRNQYNIYDWDFEDSGETESNEAMSQKSHDEGDLSEDQTFRAALVAESPDSTILKVSRCRSVSSQPVVDDNKDNSRLVREAIDTGGMHVIGGESKKEVTCTYEMHKGSRIDSLSTQAAELNSATRLADDAFTPSAPRVAEDAYEVEECILDREFEEKPLCEIGSIDDGKALAPYPIKLRRLRRLLRKWKQRFCKGSNLHPTAKAMEEACVFELEESVLRSWKPAKAKPQHPQHRKTFKDLLQDQIDLGIIRPSNSPYTSQALLAPKPGGKWRFCVNFRFLNKAIRMDGFQLPRIDDTLALFHGKQYFSSMDIVDAFWSVPLAEESKKYTAFCAPDGSVWEYNRLPMGVRVGSSVFSKFIARVLSGLRWSVCVNYIDDLCVWGDDFEQHIAALDAIFRRMEDYGLSFKPSKCHFMTKEFKFLGHIISKEGVRADPDKVKAILEMPVPDDKKGIKSFLGVCGYYRRLIKDFSTIASPLRECLSNDRHLQRDDEGNVIWSEKELEGFQTLKQMLASDPVMAHPDWDQPFELHTDACQHGLGAVLVQKQNGVEKVISYASRSLTKDEKKYSIWELEFLAIVWSTKLFRMYLAPPFAKKFTIKTDSSAVKYMLSKSEPGTRVMHWIMDLQMFDFDIVHRPGVKNGNADGLSRCPLRSSCPYSIQVRPLYDRMSRDQNTNINVHMPSSYKVQQVAHITCGVCEREVEKADYAKHIATCVRNAQAAFQHARVNASGHEASDSRCQHRDISNSTTRCSENAQTACPTCDEFMCNQHIREHFTHCKVDMSELCRQTTQVEQPCKGIRTRSQNVRGGRNEDLSEKKRPDDDYIESPTELESHRDSEQTETNKASTQKNSTADSTSYFGVMDEELPVEGGEIAIQRLVQLQKKDSTCIRIMEQVRDQTTSEFHQRNDDVLMKGSQIVVPKTLRKFLLRQYHGLPLSGHRGASKVIKMMSKQYWWNGMGSDIRKWCASCLSCCRRKVPRNKHAGLPSTMCSPAPFYIIAMDLIGPLTPTDEGHVYILTMMDTFTRWIICVPIKGKSAAVVAEAIYRHLLCVHAQPVRILTDRGAEFVNAGLKAMCKRWGISQIQTSPRNSKGNGHVERFHRYLHGVMATLHVQFGKNWDQFVDAVAFAHRVSVHDSTGFSPYELLYGRQPRLPDYVWFNIDQSSSSDYADERAYLITISERMGTVYEQMRLQQTKAAETNRKRLAKTAKDVSYKPGQYVLVWRPQRSYNKATGALEYDAAPNKWKYQWSGPHVVVRKCPRERYHYDVQDVDTGRVVEHCHVNILQPYTPWSEDIITTAPEVEKRTSSEAITTGTLIAVALPEGFGIGKMLKDNDGNSLYFQWLSNRLHSSEPSAKYENGWLNSKGEDYYGRLKRNPRDHAYTSRCRPTTTVYAKDLILHGFILDPEKKLPLETLTTIRRLRVENFQ